MYCSDIQYTSEFGSGHFVRLALPLNQCKVLDIVIFNIFIFLQFVCNLWKTSIGIEGECLELEFVKNQILTGTKISFHKKHSKKPKSNNKLLSLNMIWRAY